MPRLRSSDAYARRSGQGRTERRYGRSVVPRPIALINGVASVVTKFHVIDRSHRRPPNSGVIYFSEKYPHGRQPGHWWWSLAASLIKLLNTPCAYGSA